MRCGKKYFIQPIPFSDPSANVIIHVLKAQQYRATGKVVLPMPSLPGQEPP